MTSATTTRVMKVCGMPKRAARGEPGQGLELVAVAEADGGVVHVPARDAAIDQQAAQGDDEGLHPEPGDEEAVDGAEHDADADRERQRQLPGQAVIDHEVGEDHADQREHRAHRELDAAGDDDQPLADREQAEQPDQVRHVDEVDRREEARVEGGREGADDQDQDEEAEVLLVHAS